MGLENYKFNGIEKFDFKNFDTKAKDVNIDKQMAEEKGRINIIKMADLQDRFYAQGDESLLIIFQAMDAGGKDGAIKHVMCGLNPQGVEVTNFKKPSLIELSHDYLWRANNALPPKGKIGIFNRSYYEDVLVSKVHELYKTQSAPPRCKTDEAFYKRYDQIINFEKYLWENGTRIIKFFLNISKEEQKKRFLKRIDRKDKNWKLSDADIKEREYWQSYMSAFESAINKTATEQAPWFVIPADKKWLARYFISEIVVETLENINPQYPKVSKNKKEIILKCKEKLLREEKSVKK